MYAGTTARPLRERWEFRTLQPCDVAELRNRVRNEIADRGYASDDAVLVASELLTNTVCHTSGDGALWLEIRGDEIFVGVSDRSTRQPRMSLPDWKSTCGRGLVLVKELSNSWHVNAERHGKLVYALLPLRPPQDDGDSSWGAAP